MAVPVGRSVSEENKLSFIIICYRRMSDKSYPNSSSNLLPGRITCPELGTKWSEISQRVKYPLKLAVSRSRQIQISEACSKPWLREHEELEGFGS